MALSNSDQKKTIRKQFRALRNQLTEAHQNAAAESLVQHFCDLANTDQPSRVAVFLSNDGELSPHKVVAYCWSKGISTYLPVIDTENPGFLRFYEYTDKTPLKPNCYGIPEPDVFQASRIDPISLDWILMPLVAFTNEGQRLGMGGGFYDRTLETTKDESTCKTRLIGLAHECQCTENLPVDAWDIDMHAVLTPQRSLQL